MVRVLLLGATGLVGAEVLRLLLADAQVASVTVVARKELPGQEPGIATGKLRWVVSDLNDLKPLAGEFSVDAVICALGTTIRKAGSRTEFERVDLRIPLAAAALARSQGATHFVLVSAMGANPRSPFFYNRVKGELEGALSILGYPALTIARPSLLLGERQERRPLEAVLQKLAGMGLPMIPAFWRPVLASQVARALVDSLHEPPKGHRVLWNRTLTAY